LWLNNTHCLSLFPVSLFRHTFPSSVAQNVICIWTFLLVCSYRTVNSEFVLTVVLSDVARLKVASHRIRLRLTNRLMATGSLHTRSKKTITDNGLLKTILSKPEAVRNLENTAGYGQQSRCASLLQSFQFFSIANEWFLQFLKIAHHAAADNKIFYGSRVLAMFSHNAADGGVCHKRPTLL